MAGKMGPLFVLLLLAFSKVSYAQTCDDTDSIALSYFALETVFVGNAFLTWIDGTDCCTWKGVSCNSAGRVHLLNVVASKAPPPVTQPTSYLVGTGLSDLSELTSLKLENISLNGVMPPAWSNLEKLTVLHVEQCNTMGNLPEEFCKLTNMQTLNFKNNKLNGTVPACISRMPLLTNLDLSGNSFRGNVPSIGVISPSP